MKEEDNLMYGKKHNILKSREACNQHNDGNTACGAAESYKILPHLVPDIRLLNNFFKYVGFEVFTSVTMKNAVFWNVAPCRSCEMLLPAHVGSSLADFSTLKMEAIRSSETSVHFTGSTRRHIPEDGILRNFEINIIDEGFQNWRRKA
jgi:hypothetical protein